MTFNCFMKKLALICLCAALITLMGTAQAQQTNPYGGYQQPPGMPQSPYGPYSQQPPAQNPNQQVPNQQVPNQQVPNQQPPNQQPPNQQQNTQPGLQLTDAFAQFRIGLPQGAQPVTSTYMLTVPTSGLQVLVSATLNQQVFQSHVQGMPAMIQQQGGRIVQDRQINYQNMQCRYILAEMQNQAMNQAVDMHYLLIPGPNVLLQITCPQQSRNAAQQALDMMLDNLQVAKPR